MIQNTVTVEKPENIKECEEMKNHLGNPFVFTKTFSHKIFLNTSNNSAIHK